MGLGNPGGHKAKREDDSNLWAGQPLVPHPDKGSADGASVRSWVEVEKRLEGSWEHAVFEI